MRVIRTAHNVEVSVGRVEATDVDPPDPDATIQFIEWPPDVLTGPLYITWVAPDPVVPRVRLELPKHRNPSEPEPVPRLGFGDVLEHLRTLVTAQLRDT